MTKSPQVSCIGCTHRCTNAFAKLAGPELERLDTEKATQTYKRGEVLYREGAPALAAHCIYSGWLELCVVGELGRTQGIRLVGPGRLVGYPGILSDRPHTTTAKTVADTTACLIPKSTLQYLINQSQPFAFELLKRMANDYFIFTRQLTNAVQHSVRRRLAAVLIDTFAPPSVTPSPSGDLAIPLMRTELAELASTTPETCSRELAQMSEEGVVTLTRNTVIVKDFPALQKIAGSGVASVDLSQW